MSGTALTTVSPSSVKRMRRVVCVAGCCGPKLSVQRYSLSVESAEIGSTNSTGIYLPLHAWSPEFLPPFARGGWGGLRHSLVIFTVLRTQALDSAYRLSARFLPPLPPL